MTWERPPIGARVRVVDVAEGVVAKHHSGDVFEFESGAPCGPLGMGIWARTVEVLELPRPDEPTARNAVVLARLDGAAGPREVFVRRTVNRWERLGAYWPWAELTDITVLHPGGVE